MSRRAHPSRTGANPTQNRVTNNDTPILSTGDEFQHELGDFSVQLQETLDHGMSIRTRKDLRCCLQRIAKFWKADCPVYFNKGVRKNTPAEMNDPSLYFYNHYEYDLVYSGFNVMYLLKFLVAQKKKKASDSNTNNQAIQSYDDIRKYRDAVHWGARVRNESLCDDFWLKMETFLSSYKRETRQAKKNGNLLEKEADPISLELYHSLLGWAVDDSNTFAMFWSQCQWNCIARCISIDPLGFRNFSLGPDSIIVTYHETKKDKTGERCFGKNIYPNSQDWLLCHWTGMGLYCALNVDRLATTDKLFLDEGNKEGTASKKYQEQLQGIVNRTQVRKDAVRQHCRLGHFNAHGLRKGPASFATSGTTLPPSLPSVAHRGEWSMGSVFDIYWKFLPIGDHYLGQILSGKDPNDASFASLPPHWNCQDPLNHPKIKQAMDMAYGPILRNHENSSDCDPTGILTRCLACVIWHFNSIRDVMVSNPGHEFNKIALLHELPLLNDLKQLVTTEPTPGLMTTVTGVPPHVGLAVQLKSISGRINKLLEEYEDHEEDRTQRVINAVVASIEGEAVQSGHLTGRRLEEILSQHFDSVDGRLKKALKDVQEELLSYVGTRQERSGFAQTTVTARRNNDGGISNSFSYNDKTFFWHVPEMFDFPKKPQLSQALRLWLKGQTASSDGKKVIRPYRNLKASHLPNVSLRNKLRGQWMQFFKFVEPAFEPLPRDTTTMSEADLAIATQNMWDYLETRVSYCFVSSRKRDPKQNLLSYWARKVTTSEIKANGTASDKEQLGGLDYKKRKNHTRTRRSADRPLYPDRQQNRQKRRRMTPAFTNLRASLTNAQIWNEEEDQRQNMPSPTVVPTHYDEQASGYLQYLVDEFGTKAPYPEAQTPQRLGRCAVALCTEDKMQLEGSGSHHCRRCGIVVHNLCVQARGWFVEDDTGVHHYCSEHCKSYRKEQSQFVNI